MLAHVESDREARRVEQQALTDSITQLNTILSQFISGASEESKSDAHAEKLNRNALAVVLTLLARTLPEDEVNQAVSLSHLTVRHPETPVVQRTPDVAPAKIDRVLTQNAKPKKPAFKSPKPGSAQYEFIEWLLTGASEVDGDADHYENELWYIKRILSGDPSMSTSFVTSLATEFAPEEANMSRATVGRLLPLLKKGEYNEHIAQRCHELSLDVSKVFPGTNPKAKFDGKGWTITEE